MMTMADVGAEHGCGRSFWEYEKEINRYGTPMALMLLPHWTDGCIGSMEGLFFEASATTPFHFLTQVELSAAPSAAQRDLPYGSFDIDKGVRHLQLMGVRYYLATSAEATTAARAHPDLTELATSGPWVIFQVADSELVTAARERTRGARRRERRPERLDLPHQGRRQVRGSGGALVPGPRRPGRHARLVGPRRVAARRRRRSAARCSEPVDAVEVTDLEVGTDGISFDVDQVGLARAGEGVLLPELARHRCGRSVPGGAEPDGRGADRRARRADLRTRTRSSGWRTG